MLRRKLACLLMLISCAAWAAVPALAQRPLPVEIEARHNNYDGPGDPVGAVVAYEGKPYPASAVAIEHAECILVRRNEFFALFERHPSFVRGFLTGMAQRIVELTRRIPEVAGGRVETRFAHLFLKLADRVGRPHAGGRFVPMHLSRQELADLTGTTIETCIRIMSRWGKDGVVSTEREGFLVTDRATLERLVEA